MRYLLVMVLTVTTSTVTAAMAEEATVHQVQTATVVQRDVDETLHVYGRVSFDDAWLQNINLAYAGQLIRLPVLAGESVSKGQLLAEIVVDPSAASAYQQAQSAVRFAESELGRIRSLLADQLATTSQLGAAEKALADSQSQLRQLKKQGLGRAIHEIHASYDAIVATVLVQSGQRVAAGTTLMQLGHPDRLKVLLGLEAEDVRWISSGNPVEIHSAMNPESKVTASIDKVLHAVNPKTRLVDVLVRISGEQSRAFLPGMAVSADISARLFPHALVLLRQAVLYADDNKTYVMRVEQGMATRVPVRVALEKDGYALVQGALVAGQTIVTVGVAELSDGDAVVVEPVR